MLKVCRCVSRDALLPSEDSSTTEMTVYLPSSPHSALIILAPFASTHSRTLRRDSAGGRAKTRVEEKRWKGRAARLFGLASQAAHGGPLGSQRLPQQCRYVLREIERRDKHGHHGGRCWIFQWREDELKKMDEGRSPLSASFLYPLPPFPEARG